MEYKILGPNDYKNMPWKNGGGTTCEILREPAGDSLPFDWRVSIADIKANGPFSLFQGYSRVINTLEGAGMRLTVDGQKSGDLTRYIPFAFSGESTVESELINGPIRDFNLIYRTAACQARLEWRNTDATFITQANHLIIYAVGQITVNGISINLPAAHTLHITGPQTINIGAQDYYCLIELTAQLTLPPTA